MAGTILNWSILIVVIIFGICLYGVLTSIVNFFTGLEKLVIKIAEKQGISKEEIERLVGKYGEE